LIDKPGHRHQAQGVAQVVARARPARSQLIEVSYRFWAHRSLRSRLVEIAGVSPAFWLKLIYGIDVRTIDPPDMVIGSGRPCVAAGIFLARHFKAPFVYAGPAAGMSDARFIDRILTNVPSRANNRNAVHTPVPNLVDPDAWPAPRPLRQVDDLRGASVALMLGGNSAVYTFAPSDWTEIAELVAGAHRELGVRWWVSTSRRTAKGAVDVFRALCASGAIERFVDWNVAGSGSAASFFGADAMVVTEDSFSMMSEAVTARRPVVGLRPRHETPPATTELVDTLVAGGALVKMPEGAPTTAGLVQCLLRARPIRHDTRDVIAAALAPILEALPK
jgi:mitochondrial fission protein ELM1